ncbi:MAG: hypothetical protein KA324_13625 [Rubrivivax sp.]|nr:hypothetical protein [Rubrivivax sp.]MBP6504510.1 hypothetical protein [Rhodoferax sp.]
MARPRRQPAAIQPGQAAPVQPREPGNQPVQVVALARGYYGQLREAGDVFTVAHAGHVGRWMRPVCPAAD